MEDTLLIDAAERFARGEMSIEEKIYFEDLRKNNPELDQAVVEQLFFLNQLESYSNAKNFKSLLGDVESKLITEKFISRTTPQKQGKLVQLWHRYKKDIAVAASIAGLVSIFITTAVSTLSKTDKNIDKLVQKIDAQANETRAIKTALKGLPMPVSAPARPKIDARFRATGFMIDVSNNYIVTNAHVIKEATHNLIVENRKGDEYTATAVYINAEQDLAIIRITDSSFKTLPYLPYNIRKSAANLGESIFMLGYPKAEIVYGEGYVSAKNGYEMDTTYCQISTSANEGNSGSPVISKNGDLIGIITSKETKATGVVFAIKSANIFKAIGEVKKQKADEKIRITAAPSLRGLDRETQIKKMEDYVFMIKGN